MDFEEDSKIKVTEEDLKELSKLANKQLVLEMKIDELEKELESYKKQLKLVAEGLIPEAMQKIGMSSFALTNGAEITVKSFYSGKIDDENRYAATKWLNENGHGAILKKELVLDFGKKEGIDWQPLVKKVKELVREKEEIDINATVKEGVHHATLNAFIKEQVQGGKEFPLDIFKAYVGTRAKISFN